MQVAQPAAQRGAWRDAHTDADGDVGRRDSPLRDAVRARDHRRAGIDIPAARTILAGSSHGGLAAMTVALAHPEGFGNVIALSGAFWCTRTGSSERVAPAPRRPLRVHLTAGLFEGGHPGTGDILESMRRLRETLEAQGYAVTERDDAGGHDDPVWRGALGDGLLARLHAAGDIDADRRAIRLRAAIARH